MEPFRDWKEDFEREVDEVLAAGKSAPLPEPEAPAAPESPAGGPELPQAGRRRTELEALMEELRGGLKRSEALAAKERERGERWKRFAVKLRGRLRALKKELAESRLDAKGQAHFAERLAARLKETEAELEDGRRRLVEWAADSRGMQAGMDKLAALLGRRETPP